jgi:Spy/CpxP family protein refolding chaperone
MKTALLALMTSLVLALSASALQAQPGSGQGGGPGLGGGGGMRMNPEARVQQLLTALEITPEQEPAFREAMAKVNELQMAAMAAMRQGGGQGGDKVVVRDKAQDRGRAAVRGRACSVVPRCSGRLKSCSPPC